MIDRNTPEYAAIVAILDDGEMAMQRPDSQETADLIVAALGLIEDVETHPAARRDSRPVGEGDPRDAQDRAERHSIAQFLGVDADILARIDALPIPETDWRSIAEAGAAQLADLVAAVEIMDQKIVPLSERDDGTVSQYGIGDSTWHRVLAVARGHVSEKARQAIDAAFAASPSLQAGPAAVRPAREDDEARRRDEAHALGYREGYRAAVRPVEREGRTDAAD